jgi:hypothetical protein
MALPPGRLLNIRSPYIISINEPKQIETKVELRIWNRTQKKPTPATFVLTKKIASATQRETIYNISKFIEEFINPVIPQAVVLAEESQNNMVFVEVKTFYKTTGNFILKATLTYEAVEGYNLYVQGSSEESTKTILRNNNIKVQYSTPKYVNAFLLTGLYEWNGTQILIDTTNKLYKLPIQEGENILNKSNIGFSFFQRVIDDGGTFEGGCLFDILTDLGAPVASESFIAEQVCEPKYTPVQCNFINRHGGWEFLTFFKAKTERIDTKSENFQLLPESYDYNPQIGQSQDFNFSGTQSITLNTGFVPENYKELIQDLLLSTVVLLDSKPVKLKTKSTSLKQNIIDKNINYTMEFEYDYNLINDVI